MAANQPKTTTKKKGRQSLKPGVTFLGKNQRSQRSIRKGARQKETLHQWKESKDKNTEPKHSAPSPSTSNTPSEEDSQSSPVLPKATESLERSQRSTLDSRPEEFKQPCYQNGLETGGELERKRKRSQEAEYPTSRIQEEPIEKRARTSLASCAVEDKEAASSTGNKSGHAINYWTQRGTWPEEYFKSDPNMNQQLSRKHSSSGMSYTQSVKDGENPPAYSPEYESVLAKAGIFMYQSLGQATISDICKELCVILLSGEYEPPEHSLFQDSSFWITLEKVRSKNEARVVRDIMPSIVPSAELLHTHGVQDLQYLTEEISADWTKCICLAGPRPKPDYAVGLISSAFTDDEVQRLKSYTSPAKATLFTGNIYFPFLMCEVKCGENGLNIADRQNAHSTSMAVDAIVQLYRKASEGKDLCQENQTVTRLMDLHRKILCFSISHDHAMVRIYGHYPLIDGDKTTFHRYLIREYSVRDQDGKEKWTAYNFTRKIYDTFVPIHLDRIRNAIVRLPDPEFESFISIASTENESDLPDSQEPVTSAPSSQGNVRFKKPKLPPKAMLQKEVDRQSQDNDQLKQDNAGLKGQIDLLLRHQTPSNASSGNESMLQQEYDRLMGQTKELKQDNTRLKGQIDLLLKHQSPSTTSKTESELRREHDQLEEQLNQQRQERRQEVDRLTGQNKQLMDRLKESMDLFKQQTSANA